MFVTFIILFRWLVNFELYRDTRAYILDLASMNFLHKKTHELVSVYFLGRSTTLPAPCVAPTDFYGLISSFLSDDMDSKCAIFLAFLIVRCVLL